MPDREIYSPQAFVSGYTQIELIARHCGHLAANDTAMSLRSVQRQAAARYSELGADLSSSLRPQQPIHRTAELTTTARLLRNSRLFSLPKPLKTPVAGYRMGGQGGEEVPDSATLPYPTRAAVTTHAKSLSKGDWGLKRELPRKAFRTSTPVLRVQAVDSIDHITEFESAADHVLTLQKIQEMNIPVVLPKGMEWRQSDRMGNFQKAPASAFEEFCDPKQRPKEPFLVQEDAYKPTGWGINEIDRRNRRRWRYDGPWIAGMPTGDFQEYVSSVIKNKRAEFRDWLRKELTRRRSLIAQKKEAINVDAGVGPADEPEADSFAAEILEEVSEGNKTPAPDTVDADILDLRNHPRELFSLIWKFLDLPGHLPSFEKDLGAFAEENIDIEHGPPVTHPSAGLSYLRPVRQLYNHPALGPMQDSPPVPGRQLQRPSRAAPQVLGVGGVAVARHNNKISDDGQTGNVSSLLKQGGQKLWVHVDNASIDSKGNIKLAIRGSHTDNVNVWYPEPREDEHKRSWGVKSDSKSANRMPKLTAEPEYRKITDVDNSGDADLSRFAMPK